MRARLLLSLLLPCVGLAVEALAEGCNLLVNAGFETDGLGGSSNWAFDAEPERLPSAGPGGATAIRIRGLTYQRGFKAVTGERYRYSALVRTSACRGRLALVNGRWWSKELSAQIPADTHGEWRLVEGFGEMVPLGASSAPVPKGTVGKGQFCVVPSKVGESGYIDICDPQVIPLSPEAVRLSSPAAAERKFATRVVPVDPLLDEVDSENARMRFYYPGDLSAKPVEYIVEATVDGGAPVGATMNDKREATVVFGRVSAGRHEMTVRLKHKATGDVVKENRYPITARPHCKYDVNGRRLNNLVTEIANHRLVDGEFEFVNPREGWVFVGFDAPYAHARAFIDRGVEPVVRFRPGERSETMRYLAKGRHTLLVTGVRGDEKAAEGRFTIRLVKTLFNRSLDFKSDKTDFANYQYRVDYYRRWIYGSFNTLAFYQNWQCSPREVAAADAEFGPRGVRIFRQIDCSPADVKLRCDPRRLADLMENSRSYRDGYELSMDETGFTTTPCAGFVEWGEYLWSTVERRLPQPIHQWWCDVPLYVPQNRQILVSPFSANLNSGGGRGLMLLETYHGAYADEAKVDRELEALRQYYAAIGRMVPAAPTRALPLFGGFLTLGHFSNAVSPEGDIKGVYDKFMHAIATDPAFAEVGGIGMTGYFCDEELPRWCAKAIRYYAIDGGTERLGDRYGITAVPGILNDGDFSGGLSCWTVASAEEGGVSAGHNSSLGSAYQKRTARQGSGAGNTFALFTRSAKAPNVISRQISGLKKGRLYSLQFCTCDYADILKPGKNPTDLEFRAVVRGAESIEPLRLVRKWPSWGQKKPQVTFFTERQVFRAKGEKAEIVFSDWQSDSERRRPAGEQTVLNYVSVKPYFADDGDLADLIEMMERSRK